MHVERFMTKNPVTCETQDDCTHVAQLMRDKNVGSVIVLRDGKVAGLVTDRQLAVDCLAKEGSHDNEAVERFMTEDPACCTLEDNLFSVIDTMRSAGVVERVPVVTSDKTLLGVVSVSDIAVIAKDLFDHILLNETHQALNEARILTGAKRIGKKIRCPTKLDRLTGRQELRPVRRGSPSGLPTKTGGVGAAARGRRSLSPMQQTKRARSIGRQRRANTARGGRRAAPKPRSAPKRRSVAARR